MTGKGRRGSPPLPRQRRALRVVQLTLITMAVVALWLAAERKPGLLAGQKGVLAEVVVLAGLAISFLALAAWMGLRTVRGPQPPSP